MSLQNGFFSFVTLNGCDDRLMVILVVEFPREGYNKSVNLQYITLGGLHDGTNESSTKSLMFQVLFFLYFFIDLPHCLGIIYYVQ